MKKTIIPFFILVGIIFVSLFIIFSDENGKEKEKIDIKTGLVDGDQISTFEELTKVLEDDDVLVTVNGKKLTLAQGRKNAIAETSMGNARQEQYQSDNEVQREINQFISYVVFYDTFPVTKKDFDSEKELIKQSLIAQFGEKNAMEYIPDNELIKYIIAERKALIGNPTISLENSFKESMVTAEIDYDYPVLEKAMENINPVYIKDFL